MKQKASAKLATERRYHVKARSAKVKKKLCTLLDLCVSSLRRGHANLLCIVPILTDDPRRESEVLQLKILCVDGSSTRHSGELRKISKYSRRGTLNRDHPLKLERYRED